MSAKHLYGFLVIVTLAMMTILGAFYRSEHRYKTPVAARKNSDGLNKIPTEQELLKKVFDTVNSKLEEENMERLYQMILSITNMENKEDIDRLKDTLSKHKKILPSIQTQIMSFQYQSDRNDHAPQTILNPKAKIEHEEMWLGYKLPIIVANPAGGVGNIMGQYGTVFGLYKTFNVTALITTTLKANLNRFYDNISLETVDLGVTGEEKAARGWIELHKDHPTAPSTYYGLQLGAAGFLGPNRFFTSGCPIEVQIFGAFREDFKREFAFNDYLVSQANEILMDFSRQAVLTKSGGRPVYVGVHVRLKDYVRHMQFRWGVIGIADKYKDYLKRAIQYYKDRYQNTIFVVASDDVEYIEEFVKNLRDTNVFTTHGTQGEDMCILTRCNQSIITLGTFGFWSAFIKKSGSTVYPDVVGESAKTYHFTRKVIEESQLEEFIPLPF